MTRPLPELGASKAPRKKAALESGYPTSEAQESDVPTSGLKMKLFYNKKGGGIHPEEVRAAFASPAVASTIERFLVNEEQKKPGTTKFLRNAATCTTGESGPISACLCSRVKNSGLGEQYWFSRGPHVAVPREG